MRASRRALTALVITSALSGLLALGMVVPRAEAAPPVSVGDYSKPPPPYRYKTIPITNGRVDLPGDLERGWIEVLTRPGRHINDLVRKHGLIGASYRIPPPFTPAQIRAGVDRSFRLRVPVGAEKATVRRLYETAKDDFYWVQPSWLPTGHAQTPPDDPKYIPYPANVDDEPLMWINPLPAWDRTHGDPSVVIAVVDSGLLGSHEDLGCSGSTVTSPKPCTAKQKPGWDYLNFAGTELATNASGTLAGQAIQPGTGHESVNDGLKACDPNWILVHPPTTPADTTDVDGLPCASAHAGGHGTGVASIAAADTNNHTGMPGVGYDSSILPVRVLKFDGTWPSNSLALDDPRCDPSNPVTPPPASAQTRPFCYKLNLDTTIWWLMQQPGVAVINMSFDYSDKYDPFIQAAIDQAAAAKITIVTGAGNSGQYLNSLTPRYPCAYNNVICVGGVGYSSGRWDGPRTGPATNNRLRSAWGPAYVDVTAPSWNVRNATATSSLYARSNGGVSYAAPMVSGVAALLASCGVKGSAAVLNVLAPTAHGAYNLTAEDRTFMPAFPDNVQAEAAAEDRTSAYGLIDAGAALTFVAGSCGLPPTPGPSAGPFGTTDPTPTPTPSPVAPVGTPATGTATPAPPTPTPSTYQCHAMWTGDGYDVECFGPDPTPAPTPTPTPLAPPTPTPTPTLQPDAGFCGYVCER